MDRTEDMNAVSTMNAEDVMNAISGDGAADAAEPGEMENPAGEEPHEETNDGTPEGRETDESELAAMTAAIKTLLEDGWTREELEAFAADETAQREMAQGRSIRQAARAFDLRQHAAQRARKKGVPTLRTTASGGEKSGSMIEEMSDEEFARFSDAAYQALMQNKRVAF